MKNKNIIFNKMEDSINELKLSSPNELISSLCLPLAVGSQAEELYDLIGWKPFGDSIHWYLILFWIVDHVINKTIN